MNLDQLSCERERFGRNAELVAESGTEFETLARNVVCHDAKLRSSSLIVVASASRPRRWWSSSVSWFW